MTEAELVSRDGVAVAARGDVVLVVYQLAAKLERTRWLFDEVDRLAAARPNGFMGLLLILPTSDPPDAPTRAENVQRIRKYGRNLRRMVTVCIGDEFRISVARAIMRSMSIIQGFSRPTFVTETVDRGLLRLLDGGTRETPARDLVLLDLSEACRALGVEPREVPIPQPTPSAAMRARSVSG